MKCPNDDSDLVMSERQGIEIDYCPKCRGVWLDRGELDKIIERAAAEEARLAAAPPPQASVPQHRERRDDDDRYRGRRDYDDDDDRRYGKDYRHKKRKSMLGDLFDFG